MNVYGFQISPFDWSFLSDIIAVREDKAMTGLKSLARLKGTETQRRPRTSNSNRRTLQQLPLTAAFKRYVSLPVSNTVLGKGKKYSEGLFSLGVY